ncbi:uncharacterized protein MELLADRAFT_102149 [Melampsora larici-populina 98AG31]|uniref:Uncharacterized protein n=1 Tax=Melampsora larici-populina (strain 98AG31 / pathotype 3-4-7) TaxID=747676 RepID=F4R7C5_MELLP|nr:uncharacterized protein MELLADRAFT_102149 [Melampsora larici-populina 98AG31]EGG11809.1 hypothetical protein MELLADRAFT_102149 [Melampsora larici-populina 98AG31]
MSTKSRLPKLGNSSNSSTSTTPRQRYLAQLSSQMEKISHQSDRLSRLVQQTTEQLEGQRQLGIYYSSMLMAAGRVFNAEETNSSPSSTHHSRLCATSDTIHEKNLPVLVSKSIEGTSLGVNANQFHELTALTDDNFRPIYEYQMGTKENLTLYHEGCNSSKRIVLDSVALSKLDIQVLVLF